MSFWSWKKLWMLSCIALVFTACQPQPSFRLSKTEVSQGESVTASLDGIDGTQAKVSVAGIAAEVTDAQTNSVTFTIPATTPEGSQEIVITSGDRTARGTITIRSANAPRFTLTPAQAAPGDDVTASLFNLDGTNARVFVGNKEANVVLSTADSLVFTVPDVPEGAQEVIIRSSNAEAKGTLNVVIVPGSFILDRGKATRGETVTVTVTDIDLSKITGFVVARQDVEITPVDATSFTFVVPANASAGPQTVTLETAAGNLNQTLGILGDIVLRKLTLLLRPDVTQEQLQAVLGKLGFTFDTSLVDSFRPLGEGGPCGSTLADIDVGDKPLGQAIEELEKEGITLSIDPRSNYSTGAVDYLSAVGASIARNNLFTGKGTTIAVIDTGVSAHPELPVGRLVSPFNAITNGTTLPDVADDYTLDSVGHGTPIAVLAAGSTSGVASEASIMPIKAFNKDGVGFSSDVIVGVCHALTVSKNNLSNLILNLSFGGDTPVDALQAILDYALKNGVQVAAAAGNQGDSRQFQAPQLNATHYPAAFELEGLVAVGALQASNLQCLDFDQQSTDVRYGVGQTLTDNGVTITFKAFTFSNGQTFIGGSAFINVDEGGNRSLTPGNINADFAFIYPLDGLTFSYFDTGGNENLEVNGVLSNVEDLSELNGTTVSGVKIFVAPRTGLVRLEGPITQLAIGGQELIIDNVCPSKASAWQPAIFSTSGPYVDISAPGADLRSGTPSGSYADGYEGTSFSTPLVAGAMALWNQADSGLSPAQIEANLKRDAIRLSFPLEEVGAGLLNLNVAPFNVPPVSLQAIDN
jgi:subtilisin